MSNEKQLMLEINLKLTPDNAAKISAVLSFGVLTLAKPEAFAVLAELDPELAQALPEALHIALFGMSPPAQQPSQAMTAQALMETVTMLKDFGMNMANAAINANAVKHSFPSAPPTQLQ